MFLEFYGLKKQPFGVTPDPGFLYPSRTHTKAFYSLSQGIEANCGFLALIAQPGMGKTTLLLQLLKHFENEARAVFLSQTQCSSRELLHYLLRGLGAEGPGQAIPARELLAGRRFLLVIDECQNLDSSVLETVRLLSNFETPQGKLMQIILAGQTEFADKLASPDLAQLRQRISILSRLEPLTQEETIRYIEHRLQVAGYTGSPLFLADALQRIVARSGGIPRNINNLCFNALLAGFAATRREIDAATVGQVLADLEMNSPEPSRTLAQQEPPALSPAPRIPEPSPSGLTPEDLRDAVYRVKFKLTQELAARITEQRAAPSPLKSSLSSVARHDPLDLKPASLYSGASVISDVAAISPAEKTSQVQRRDTRGPLSLRWGSSTRRKVAEVLALGTALTMIGLLSFNIQVREHSQTEGRPPSMATHPVTPPPAPQDLNTPATASSVASSAAEASLGLRPFSLTHTLGLKIGRIVIDPGHGGQDTGAIGPTGLKEDDVCLDVALRLGHIIEQRHPGSDVIFTRTDNRFVSLEERASLANEKEADLFLSIHANSNSNHAHRGAETYYLNLRGSSEAMEVAARENAMAQETMSNLEKLLKKIAKNEKIEQSREFAENIEASLSRQLSTAGIRMKDHGVRRAPFVVLTGVNMPSALAEISFLSNPFDEQLLRTDSYRQRLAEGLYQGVLSYLESLNSVTYDLPGRNRDVIPSALSSAPGGSKATEQAQSHH